MGTTLHGTYLTFTPSLYGLWDLFFCLLLGGLLVLFYRIHLLILFYMTLITCCSLSLCLKNRGCVCFNGCLCKLISPNDRINHKSHFIKNPVFSDILRS